VRFGVETNGCRWTFGHQKDEPTVDRADAGHRLGQFDFREFLEELKRIGELVEIDDRVDPDLEAGAVMSLANKYHAPAQLFNNVKGVLSGARMVNGIRGNRARLAVTLGLSHTTDYHTLVDFYGRIAKQRLPPQIVDSGPCQQNVLLRDEVDITRFPAPRYRPQDKRPYIGTMSVGVTKDPDSDWTNWGTYRGMLQDTASMGVLLYPFGHGGMIMRRYHARGKPMEYAQFYGGDPVYHLLAGSGIDYGVSEVEVAGGIRQEPVKLVKCKTVDLYVPASAELVLEGTIAPEDRLPEGPFGEFPGYVVTGELEREVLRVSAVTYRDDPILPVTIFGAPISDSPQLGIEMSARIKQSLLAKGLPIDRVAVPICCGHFAIVVSTDTPYAGIPQMIAQIVWTDRNGMNVPHVFVVNTDVDPADLEEVFHAFATKCNPVEGISIFKGMYNCPLAPYLHRNPMKEKGFGGGNVLYDCTWPVDWPTEKIPHRLAFENTYPDELKARVLAKARKWKLI
jgi:4-hydroxy-3-polyprenylbenzoate decarboxylase